MGARAKQRHDKLTSVVKSVNAGILENPVAVAQITKSYNITGEVVIKTINPLLEDLEIEKEPVFIYFNELPVPFFIESISFRGNAGAIIKFETVDTPRQSEELVGKKIYLSCRSVKETALGMVQMKDMESFINGYKVENQEGRNIGTVTGFLNYSANPCIEIKLGEGLKYALSENGSVPSRAELPFNEELILELDTSNRIIRLKVPQGIIL